MTLLKEIGRQIIDRLSKNLFFSIIFQKRSLGFGLVRSVFSALTLFFVISSTLFLVSCSTPQKRKEPPAKASASSIQQYQRAEKIKDTQKKTAANILNKIINENPDSEVADDSLILLGRMLYENGDYSNALKHFLRVIESETSSPREGEAKVLAAQTLLRLNQHSESLNMVREALSDKGLSEDLRARAYEIATQVYIIQDNRMALLTWYAELAQKHPNAEAREKSRVKALEIIETKLNEDELEKVAGNSNLGYLRGPALYKYGVILFDQQDFDDAIKQFENVISISPESEYARLAKGYIQQMTQRKKVNPRTIGLVIPLSGKMARYGERTMNGIQLGLGLIGDKKEDFVLAVVDSDGNPDVGRRAVERLVFEDNAIAIVGSVLSKDASAVASRANELGVPSIGLSQKAGLTEIGPYVFRNAMTSEMQVRFLVDIAMDQMGIKRFAVFYPNDPYGIEFTNFFWDEVSARGGQINAAQTYDPKETDFRKPIKKLVGTYYTDDRADEYRLLLKQKNKLNAVKSTRQKEDLELLPPVVDFEAIFLPDTPKSLGIIAPTLAYVGIEKVKLLGTNVWNQPDFVKRGEKFVEDALFVDSFLLNDSQFKNSPFFQKFFAAFGYEPGIFEVQAYDAAVALRSALNSGVDNRQDLVAALSKIKGLQGAMGKISLNSHREFHRPMVALTVKKQTIVPLTTEQ